MAMDTSSCLAFLVLTRDLLLVIHDLFARTAPIFASVSLLVFQSLALKAGNRAKSPMLVNESSYAKLPVFIKLFLNTACASCPNKNASKNKGRRNKLLKWLESDNCEELIWVLGLPVFFPFQYKQCITHSITHNWKCKAILKKWIPVTYCYSCTWSDIYQKSEQLKKIPVLVLKFWSLYNYANVHKIISRNNEAWFPLGFLHD